MESTSTTKLPAWLESLLSETFFNACMIHEDAKKNEKNIFCLDCCEAICHHCLKIHNSHRLLQVCIQKGCGTACCSITCHFIIRRYVYHDVIRVGDAEKLMDCSNVQGYTTNSAKVVFLNPRPQLRACRSLSNNCISCERGLQDQYLFCSISCKINQIMRNSGMISEYLHTCEVLTLPEPGSDDWFMTPDPVFDTGPGTTEIVRKKRTSKFEIPVPALETVSRRKGLPRRSPFN